ncbi:MAG: 5-formyltetrahydrofolate cyclo-ligase [Caulobacteraceae bacterium]|nr:5-formyltetrahydrofolate cyclo-ligase [Caulobacteraceae bacterium]
MSLAAADAKTALRLVLREQRKALAAQAPDAGARAAALLPAERMAGVVVAAGYRPRGGEIDPRPLMARLAAAGVMLALPVALARDAPLEFRAYQPGDRLEPDAYNIAAPTAEAPLLRPDLVIAPLLAFDRSGGRMGQGGGHYDRTLEALRAEGPVFVLGLAYAGQESAAIPAEPHDQRLDAILTEKAYIEVR